MSFATQMPHYASKLQCSATWRQVEGSTVTPKGRRTSSLAGRGRKAMMSQILPSCTCLTCCYRFSCSRASSSSTSSPGPLAPLGLRLLLLAPLPLPQSIVCSLEHHRIPMLLLPGHQGPALEGQFSVADSLGEHPLASGGVDLFLLFCFHAKEGAELPSPQERERGSMRAFDDHGLGKEGRNE